MLAGKLHLRVSACRNGKPHLLVRIGNTRGNFLLHPEVGTFALPPSNGIKEERHHLCGNVSFSRLRHAVLAVESGFSPNCAFAWLKMRCAGADPDLILPEAGHIRG